MSIIAPLLIGVILGPLAERYFVTAMISSGNDLTVFVERPISATLVGIWLLLLGLLVFRAVRGQRQTADAAHSSELQPSQTDKE